MHLPATFADQGVGANRSREAGSADDSHRRPTRSMKATHGCRCHLCNLSQPNAASNPLLPMLQVINRWLSVRVELISNSVVLATALLVAVVLPVNAGLAGLALTSAINVTDNLAWLVRQVGHKVAH